MIYHHHDFREHSLTQRPDSMHNFPRMPGYDFLIDTDHQIMENTLGGHGHIHDFGGTASHHRQKRSAQRHVPYKIFLWRRPNDRGEIDWISALRDARNMENREFAFERIKTRMVAKRPSVRISAKST